MAEFFFFEKDFIENLRCVPMLVRCKLDMCGIKLKLAEWCDMDKEERTNLFEMPCESTEEVKVYREYLQKIVFQHSNVLPDDLAIEPFPDWNNMIEIPKTLVEKTDSLGIEFSLSQWQKLLPLQRFALVKLSKPSHESKNFPHALKEFGIYTDCILSL